MDEKKVAKAVEELLAFAKQRLYLDNVDAIYARNALLEELQLTSAEEPTDKFTIPKEKMIEPIIEWGINKLNKLDDTLSNRILYEAKIFGFVTPSPSNVVAKFDSIARNNGLESACNYLFDISKNNNYVRKVDIDKNIKWTHKGSIGDVEITINLSKPEKDPKEIEKAKLLPQTSYPKCVICKENLGFPGNAAKAARQTLRIIPMVLNKEEWFLQFSPYQYYDNHVIALSGKHVPMDVNKNTFIRLLEFVEQFPFYFMGSNAALPIVGGSILSHDHYQGGSKVLPMFKAHPKVIFESEKYKNVKFSIIDWYNSVIRMESQDKTELLEAANTVFKKWKEYNNEKINIINETDGTPHNAVTPIARYENNTYILDFILRNNITTEERPDGYFHPAKELHNIKKEGIGIIEVMGLFILPGRLKSEFEEIKQILSNKKKFSIKDLEKEENPLNKHLGMIVKLASEKTSYTEDEADVAIKNYVNKACEEILETTGVFKNTENGQYYFEDFMIKNLKLIKK